MGIQSDQLRLNRELLALRIKMPKTESTPALSQASESSNALDKALPRVEAACSARPSMSIEDRALETSGKAVCTRFPYARTALFHLAALMLRETDDFVGPFNEAHNLLALACDKYSSCMQEA
ncbi:hypothetical protein C1922_14745 [Stenotrophomonas sp. ZAC14D2_NAIMI4_7]|nr:hypothetical protein C1922_14745 [Stenotrophomonas sp. ZAC14D2_NAIMI4_7]